MQYLTDTNIILRLAEPAHPMHAAALKAVTQLFIDGQDLCLLPQNLIEFWNVATRPADKNGFGWSAAQTDAEIKVLENTFTILDDLPSIYAEWRKLVAAHSVLGKQVHDTRIVAAMNVHGVSHLLTFNIADFKRFSNIVLVNPATI